MKKFLSVLVLVLVTLVITGCQSSKIFKDNDMSDEQIASFDEQSMAIAESMIFAIRDNEYEQFIKYLDKDIKAKMPKSVFIQLRNGIKSEGGDFKDIKYLTTLEQPLTRDYIYVVTFAKPLEQPDGKEELVIRNKLFFVSFLTMEDEIKISNLGFK